MANQDPHAKQLLTSYPEDTLELFAPELLSEHGKPVSIEAVSTEIFNLNPKGKPGFNDVALKCTFADGSEHILLLVEHWSAAKDIDYRRTGRYLFELLWRHPHALVLPIMLVTDASLSDATRVSNRFNYGIADQTVVDLHFRVHVVNRDWRDRIAHTSNVVAVVLWTVPDDGHPVERCLEALSQIASMRPDWSISALQQLLACTVEFARLNDTQRRELFQRLQGDPTMSLNIIDLFEAEGMAKGKAEGKAEGEIHALLSLVADGDLSVDKARSRLTRWLAEGEIPQDMHDAALTKLAGNEN